MSLLDAGAAAVMESAAAAYADDAVYTPPGGGSPVDIRIICGWHDEATSLGGFDTAIRSPGLEGVVPRPYLASADRGATVQIFTGNYVGTYTVRDAQDDLERAEWRLDLS